MSDDDLDADEAAEAERLRPWLENGPASLAASRGNPAAVRDAVYRFCAAGRALELSPLTTWDYLIISSPGILGEAGFTDEEVEQLYPIIEEAWTAAYEGFPAARPAS